VAYIEALFAQRMTYATAMALTAVTVFAGAIVITALGREQRGIHFGGASPALTTRVTEYIPE
jgi:SHS family lactate transporter-like MFS transporter